MLKKLSATKSARRPRPASPVRVYTDGCALGNPGRGGYAVAYESGGARPKTFTGADEHATNNKMELKAVECALRKCLGHWDIVICSDSRYVVDGMNKWRHGWARNGWITKAGTPVVNADLWKRIGKLIEAREGSVSFCWVKGHAGDPMNELVDQLAKERASRK